MLGAIIIEFPHFIFIALDVRAGNVSIDFLHGLVIVPAANLHGDFCGDAKVRRERSETMPELVDGDALPAVFRTAYGHAQWQNEVPE